MQLKSVIAALAVLTIASTAARADVLGLGDVSYDSAQDEYFITSGWLAPAVSDATIEATVGLASGALDSLTGLDATEGSVIYETLEVNVGDMLSFDWIWDSHEAQDEPNWRDFAFVSFSLDGISVLADTFTPKDTGGTFEWIASSAGLLTWAVGVMDVLDTQYDSKLTVSNLLFTPGQTPTPASEPGVLSLLGLALLGLGWNRRRSNPAA